ncbi:spore protease YyaC [Heyndrickxia acidicola]|uniref:Spore protease YyaC n=1 Tax=Heyndrickxia acidicola TaxID=209389 RepID=A0ABU6MCS5_9BACI|nr:spore protease YyaC [Heyndrickxia acidicola]MED1202218.1 spore protease YyaC [Heyndrickxia acidicola]
MLNHHETCGKLDMNKGFIPYNDKLAPLYIRNILHTLIPSSTQTIYVLGIGSNRITGDSLGSLVGTLLHNLYPRHMKIIGCLASPLDAVTFIPRLSHTNFPEKSFVITVDSALGTIETKNSMVIRKGPFQPGAGLGHSFPFIGDCSVMGVVHEKDAAAENSLVFTNLHLIYTMAINIAKGISLAVRQFYRYPSDEPLLVLP